MTRVTLANSQARKIILHASGLSKRAQFGKGKEAVFKLIDHLGFVQIDTNFIVERAHHLAIAARVPDYKHEWLAELLSEGRIFEFWTFAAGYIPMRNFRFSLPVKEAFVRRRKPLTSAESNLMRKVLDRIGREGPLTAGDFENDRVVKSAGWWDWRPSKVALERLYLEGKLATLRKENFQKVYDLTENTIPRDTDLTAPTPEEFARHVINHALKALGVASFRDIYFNSRYVGNSKELKRALAELTEAGDVVGVKVEGINEPQYMLPGYKNKKITIAGDAFILSPFDHLNVCRKRLKDFFDFDYMVECFVPAPKRKYGYFSLPVLVGDTFVARMDSKADRKTNNLIIHNLHFEKTRVAGRAIDKIGKAIRDFAKFNKCYEVIIRKSNDKALVMAIQRITDVE
jgi:uncharacterized protein YcaQ